MRPVRSILCVSQAVAEKIWSALIPQPPSDRDACFHDEILVRVDARNLLMLALIGHPASAVISMLGLDPMAKAEESI